METAAALETKDGEMIRKEGIKMSKRGQSGTRPGT